MDEIPYEARLYYLLWETHARATPLADAALDARRSMTRPELGMLELISAEPGVTSAQIARRLPVTQQAVSQLAARLDALGWLERRLLGGRSVGLYLTRAGKRAREAGDAADLQFEERLAGILGEARYSRLRKSLREASSALAAAAAAAREPTPLGRRRGRHTRR
jgi:DNA-binding MarR family transcriptional regulator